MNEKTQILASRLGIFAQSSGLSFIRSAIRVIADWLVDLASESLPPREVTLEWVGSAIDQILASTDFPSVDDRLVDPFVKRALLTLAGSAYDVIAKQPPVI